MGISKEKQARGLYSDRKVIPKHADIVWGVSNVVTIVTIVSQMTTFSSNIVRSLSDACHTFDMKAYAS